MARCIFIVQGEGKGHMSQALAVKEILAEAGHRVEKVFVGGRPGQVLPEYFTGAFSGTLSPFQSPWFLRTPNNKGIYIGRTLLFNLLRFPRYMAEVHRIRREIKQLQPDVVCNFYDGVGALSLRKIPSGILRIGIGHHFFLHLDNYRCPEGSAWHRWLLKRLTLLIMNSCDRVLALSFREVPGNSQMEVMPPLVRRAYREIRYQKGKRYLAYFLNEGLLYDLVLLAREMPGFRVDVFTSLKPAMELPEGINLHPFDADTFKSCMASCKGLICSAGFDAAAEAAYHGIPLAVIPARNHYEQLCNAADIVRSGLGYATHKIDKKMLDLMEPGDNASFRRWAASAPEHLLKWLKE